LTIIYLQEHCFYLFVYLFADENNQENSIPYPSSEVNIRIDSNSINNIDEREITKGLKSSLPFTSNSNVCSNSKQKISKPVSSQTKKAKTNFSKKLLRLGWINHKVLMYRIGNYI